MKIILNDSLQPYFNLAAEEYLLENSDGDIFMLWRNSASVIIGKNQNAWAEVNTDFTEAKGIPVVRRLTGGGAVFHDPGNVNFTFITDDKEDTGIDFGRFVSPVITALSKLGISAAADGRNDILCDGFKISGNAQCKYRCADGRVRVMHHGTLLYNADLGRLAGALRVNEEKLRSKGIRSVSSRVKNIKELGSMAMSAEEFCQALKEYAEAEYGCAARGLTAEEISGIDALAQTKYSTWEWNFGKSPEIEDSRSKRFPWGTAEIGYTLDRGVIVSCSIRGDFFGVDEVSVMERALAGCRFEIGAVADALAAVDVGRVISGAAAEDITDLLFGQN